MRSVAFLVPTGVVLVTAWLVGGCSNVEQLTDPNPAYETLVVAYGDPGLTPVPCDDVLPKLDGVAEDQEWSSAPPLFVRMTGDNGSGGADYFVEIRALWTDESRVGGEDRIYFLVRYPDNDQDLRSDQLAYVFSPGGQDVCESPVPAGGKIYCTSPVPRELRTEVDVCDTLLLKNRYWTRLNVNGREDQVFLSITRAAGTEAVIPLIDFNRELLSFLGPKLESSHPVMSGVTSPVDVWAWRAGRTNLHPVPQFPEWNALDPLGENPVPPPLYSRFTQNCGYCEDYWANGGSIVPDAGQSPFVRNFGTTNPENGFPRPVDGLGDTLNTVPVWLTECPPRGRDVSDEELANQNGRVPKDQGLWLPDVEGLMAPCETLACSRTGAKPPKWSVKLVPEEFDFVPGWAMRVPFKLGGATSMREVRARGAYESTQAKGFSVWSIEIMRTLNTGQADDLPIDPHAPGEYRMVIGILDASGAVGSGSTEIRLKFNAPQARPGLVDRC